MRWLQRFRETGEISPAPTGGDRRSGRIEAHGDYLLGLVRRQQDMTLLEIQERLIANCGERFSSSVIWRFFDRHGITVSIPRQRPGALRCEPLKAAEGATCVATRVGNSSGREE